MTGGRLGPGPATWGRICNTLRARIGERNFAIWIAPLRSRWIDGALALDAPDATTRERVARHFLGAIEEALAQTAGRACPVRLGLAASPPTTPFPIRPPTRAHTFESFVVGQSNRRAFEAARTLVEYANPGALLVHGPSGVGKTHLLHATFHALESAGTPVACVAGAQFISALVAAYAAHADERFWADLLPLGALLLDDVHSIAALDEIQQRLLDGLAAWVEAGHLLVLTSDRGAAEMPGLVTLFGDRFARRVVVPVDLPDAALRLAILDHKARLQGVTLEPRLAARLATAVGDNVRRLEGALTRLLAHARLSGRVVDEALAAEVLPELTVRAAPSLTVDRVVEVTAEVFGVPSRRLRGRSRSADVLLARRTAMYLARTLLGQSFTEIGRAFARDHTTALHAWRAVQARIARDVAIAERIGQAERRLRREVG
jgi:chromosomal replication initiator protein